MAGVGPLTQDWEPVVVRKKNPTSAAKKDEKAVNAARRSGAEIETMKKATAGTNKAASSSTTLNTRKLDEETDVLAHSSPDKKPLDWSTRMKIAEVAAKGLEYLHEKAKPPVIYRDFKVCNILLDADFNPKLSDFGLAKLGPTGDKQE